MDHLFELISLNQSIPSSCWSTSNKALYFLYTFVTISNSSPWSIYSVTASISSIFNFNFKETEETRTDFEYYKIYPDCFTTCNMTEHKDIRKDEKICKLDWFSYLDLIFNFRLWSNPFPIWWKFLIKFHKRKSANV